MKNIFKNPSFKLVLAIIITSVVFGGYYGYKAFSGRAEKKDICKDICIYVPDTKVWRIGGGRWIEEKYGNKFFPERKQCIDYCLRNK